MIQILQGSFLFPILICCLLVSFSRRTVSFVSTSATFRNEQAHLHFSRLQSSSSADTDTETNQEVLPLWIHNILQDCDLRVASFEDTGRGLQSTRDRGPEEVLIQVPEEQAVTARSIQAKFPEIPADELNEEQIMALGLLLLREQGDSYVTCLPREQYFLFMSHVPTEIQETLPPAYQRLVQAYNQFVHKSHASLLNVLHQKSSSEATTSRMMEVVREKKNFEWAFATIRSRSVGISARDVFGASHKQEEANDNKDEKENNSLEDTIMDDMDNDDRIRVMLPSFDLLNHKFDARVTHDIANGTFYVVSNNEYQANDQVFISYVGREMRRNNLNMLMTYGFCPSDNPEQVVLLDSQDLLLGCARARPQYFTPAVLEQLQGLLTKLGQTTTFYTFDGSEKEPRASLTHSLSMMAEIEKQFKAEDPSFQDDLLQAMKDMRVEQVSWGRERLATLSQQVELADWKPLMGAVDQLLLLEQASLQ